MTIDITKSDIHMYHMMKEAAMEMHKLFSHHEMNSYMKCKSYAYDRDACEVYCTSAKINRLGKDFDPANECWACAYYTPEGSA